MTRIAGKNWRKTVLNIRKMKNGFFSVSTGMDFLRKINLVKDYWITVIFYNYDSGYIDYSLLYL